MLERESVPAGGPVTGVVAGDTGGTEGTGGTAGTVGGGTRPPGYDDAVERPLGAMASVGAALLLVLTGEQLTAELRTGPAWWAGLNVGYLALVVATVVALALAPARFPVARLRLLWRGLALAGLILTLAWAAVAPVADQPWIVSFLPACVGFASVGWGWRGAMAYVAASAVVPALVAVCTGSATSAAALGGDHVPLTLTNVGFVAILQGVRHQLTAIWLASQAVAERRVALARVQAELDENARVGAFIHDDVLSALLAVAADPLSSQTRRQARHAVAALQSAKDAHAPVGGEVDLAPLLEAVVRGTGADARVEVLTETSRVPAAAAEVLLAAAREAVRNAVRHGRSGASVVVTLAAATAGTAPPSGATPSGATPSGATPSGVIVTIVDDGGGFDPAAVDPRRLGVSRTVLGRLRSLRGGHADITSSPGAPTCVTLRWSR